MEPTLELPTGTTTNEQPSLRTRVLGTDEVQSHPTQLQGQCDGCSRAETVRILKLSAPAPYALVKTAPHTRKRHLQRSAQSMRQRKFRKTLCINF